MDCSQNHNNLNQYGQCDDCREWVNPFDAPRRHNVIVEFDNGDTIKTEINGTPSGIMGMEDNSMTQEPEKAPPLADHDTATMSGKVYNQLRAAWERDRANAAPQMLEALHSALYILTDGFGHEAMQPTIDKIKRAIDKAEGRA